MRKIFGIVAVAAIVLSMSGIATADHGCNGAVTQVDLPDGATTLYIDDRSGGEPGVIDHWVYQETNGEEGLQSGGDSVLGADVSSDSCEHENPDQLIF